MKNHVIFLAFVISLVFLSFNSGSALAWSGCGLSHTVQAGETLSSISRECGYTLTQVKAYNPGFGSLIFPGQVVYFYQQDEMVYSGGFYYSVQRGDTLFRIALRYGLTIDQLLSANNIYNMNYIYAGQTLFIPSLVSDPYSPAPDPWQPPVYQEPVAGYQTHSVLRGETLRILATRWGVTVYELLRLNPQIRNADFIYVGQILNTPFFQQVPSSDYYIVQRGDTLREIAGYYGVTIYDLMLLNPTIWNPNLIYVGSSIRIR